MALAPRPCPNVIVFRVVPASIHHRQAARLYAQPKPIAGRWGRLAVRLVFVVEVA